ncbi:uncharacterized protein LOC144710917 [Wolffia australiana]
MRGVTKLGLALVIVFLVCLVALAAELVYLLWYRRKREEAAEEEEEGRISARPSSKKLLLLQLFCWKSQSRVEPASVVHRKALAAPAADVDAELDKWREMYQSRALFTIKEGETEGTEPDVGCGWASPPVLPTPFATPCASPCLFEPPPYDSLLVAQEIDRRRHLSAG